LQPRGCPACVVLWETELIQIVAIRTAQGNGHAHVTDVQWRWDSTSSGQCAIEGLIAWLGASDANEAVVGEDPESLPVRIVRPKEGRAYVCACADDGHGDALLALPRF
jgi:hypothetical protein